MNIVSLRIRSYHTLALLASITAHLLICSVIGNGNPITKTASSSKTNLLVAQLIENKSVITTPAETASESATSDVSPSNKPDDIEPQAINNKEIGDDSITQDADFPEVQETAPKQRDAVVPIFENKEPYYYKTDELTEKPYVLKDISPDHMSAMPDIPQPAIVKLLINEQGIVDKVLIESSFLSDQAQRFIVESFKGVTFRPGELHSVPVKSQITIEVKLENVEPGPRKLGFPN